MSAGGDGRGSSKEFKEAGQMTLFAYATSAAKKMKLQGEDGGDNSARHLEPEVHDLPDSGTESGTDSDDSSVYEFSHSEQLQGSQGNQHITSHAPTTIVMNNISSTTISRGRGNDLAKHDVVHGKVPSDIATGRHQSPMQPTLKFPGRSFGTGRPRSFNSGWYSSFPWLEYSVECDAAFCYPCRIFSVGAGRSDSAFTQVGFRDWKHAMGKHGIISAR